MPSSIMIPVACSVNFMYPLQHVLSMHVNNTRYNYEIYLGIYLLTSSLRKKQTQFFSSLQSWKIVNHFGNCTSNISVTTCIRTLSQYKFVLFVGLPLQCFFTVITLLVAPMQRACANHDNDPEGICDNNFILLTILYILPHTALAI